MDFAFSEEQELLRAAARDYLADAFPIERVVALADGDAGWDPASWKQLADMGWLDPELGFLDHAVLAEETGAALFPGPLFSTLVLAAPLLGSAEVPATLAWSEPGGPMHLTDASRVATRADSGGRLTGVKTLVPDAGAVEVAVVVARGADDAVGLYRVDLAERPDVVVPRSTMDRTRRLGELHLDATPAERVGDAAALADVRLRAMAALACEASGVAQRALDISAEYVKTRQQFGRPVGTYQGVSHRIANIYVALQLARSLAYWAAWAVSEGDAQAADACAAAKAAAGEAAVFACEDAIQSMGGIGFTWEHPMQRYYKRAQWIDAFEGFGRVHRAAIAGTLLG